MSHCKSHRSLDTSISQDQKKKKNTTPCISWHCFGSPFLGAGGLFRHALPSKPRYHQLSAVLDPQHAHTHTHIRNGQKKKDGNTYLTCLENTKKKNQEKMFNKPSQAKPRPPEERGKWCGRRGDPVVYRDACFFFWYPFVVVFVFPLGFGLLAFFCSTGRRGCVCRREGQVSSEAWRGGFRSGMRV